MRWLERELLRWCELVTSAIEAGPGDFPAELVARELARSFGVRRVEVVEVVGDSTGPVVLSGFGVDDRAPALPCPGRLLLAARPPLERARPDQRVLARRLAPLLTALLSHSLRGGSSAIAPGPADGTVPALTGRELAVLRLLQQGLTAGGIGRRLAISERTVHKHLEACYRKLEVGDRLSAVAAGHRHGLLDGSSWEAPGRHGGLRRTAYSSRT